MVVVPSAPVPHKPGILFLSLSVTALPSLPSNLALKLTPLNGILTSNRFSAAQILISLSFILHHSSCTPAFKTSLQTYHFQTSIVSFIYFDALLGRARACVRARVYVCVRACVRLRGVCVRACVCVCVCARAPVFDNVFYDYVR